MRENGKSKPNLVFVFSDQQSFDMMGCAGNAQIHTPRLDQFASESLRLTNCYGNTPICTPWRGMLLSGMHALHNGAFANDRPMLPGKGKYFGEALRDDGYKTAYVGKWHIYGGKRDRPVPAGAYRYGFDDLFYTNNCHVNFNPGKCFYWNDEGEKVFFDEWEVDGQTRQALNYLDGQSREQERPFALFVSWHPPHDWGKTEKGYFRYRTMPDLQELYDGKLVNLRPSVPDTSEERRQQLRDYMAQVTGVDRAFGRILDKLKEKGLDDNTIVVFTSDHGDMLGSHDYVLPKGCPQDYSSRVPFLIRYPGKLPRGETNDLLFGTLDMMPTLLDMLGVDIPRSCQGRNLADALRHGDGDASDSVPMFMMHAGFESWRGLVTKNYLFAFQRPDVDRHPMLNVLYDRKSDPDQLRNLFHDPSYREIRDALFKQTLQWMEYFEDPYVTLEQLNQAGFDWTLQQDQGTSVSPIEWLREQGLTQLKGAESWLPETV